MSAARAIATPLPKAPAARSSGRSMRTFTMVSLVMVGVGVGSMVSMPTVVTVMIGMLPSLVAFIVDNRPGRYTFQCAIALNFAGVAPVEMRFWQGGGTDMNAAVAHLLDPFNLFAIYGAAAISWGLAWITPMLATVFIQAMLQYRAARLRVEDKALEQNWDFTSRDAG